MCARSTSRCRRSHGRVAGTACVGLARRSAAARRCRRSSSSSASSAARGGRCRRRAARRAPSRSPRGRGSRGRSTRTARRRPDRARAAGAARARRSSRDAISLDAELADLALDLERERRDLIARDRALGDRGQDAVLDLRAIERLAPAVVLDHERHRLLDALVGGEAAVAALALAAAADLAAVLRHAGLDDLVLVRRRRTGSASTRPCAGPSAVESDRSRRWWRPPSNCGRRGTRAARPRRRRARRRGRPSAITFASLCARAICGGERHRGRAPQRTPGDLVRGDADADAGAADDETARVPARATTRRPTSAPNVG